MNCKVVDGFVTQGQNENLLKLGFPKPVTYYETLFDNAFDEIMVFRYSVNELMWLLSVDSYYRNILRFNVSSEYGSGRGYYKTSLTFLNTHNVEETITVTHPNLVQALYRTLIMLHKVNSTEVIE